MTSPQQSIDVHLHLLGRADARGGQRETARSHGYGHRRRAGSRQVILPRDFRLPDERPRFGEGGGRADGARLSAGGDPTQADIILYNTCSIREKAAQKVFSRLGEFRKARRQRRKIIGVLGCVAQQEGEEIFERAPQVSLVCGSASYRNCPSCWRSWNRADAG